MAEYTSPRTTLNVAGEAEGPGVSDDELTALALAADPDAPLDPDAVPIGQYLGTTAASLPAWYMAPVATRRVGRGGRVVILALIAAFMIIEAFGLCSTYGQVPFH